MVQPSEHKCKNCGKRVVWIPYDNGYWMHFDPATGHKWGCGRDGRTRAEVDLNSPTTVEEDWDQAFAELRDEIVARHKARNE